MQAVLTPTNMNPDLVPLRSVQFASQADVGYRDATVNIGRVNGSTFAHLLYGDVVLWGRYGPIWRGVVESADRDGTLHLVGPQSVLGWHRVAAASYGSSTVWGYLNTVTGTGIIPTWLMPNDARYRTYMSDDGVALGAMVAPEQSQAERIAEGLKYTPWEYGWYYEQLPIGWACVPHFAAPPTTPAYVIHLSPADAEALSGMGLEGMADIVRVDYGTGRTDVVDTDPTHYLVSTTRSRFQTLAPSTCTTSANATLVGQAYLAVNAHPVSGTVSTSIIHRASGVPAYLPGIRPGSLARVVGLPSGPTILRINEIVCSGEHVASVGLGQSSGRLDTLLAKFGG